MNRKTKDLLTQASQIHQEGCVTISMNTHRTGPDYQKDPILLNNLLKQAGLRLATQLGVKDAQATLTKLETVANSIDHAHNLDSLVIFANTGFSGYAKLPVPVTDRVTIDHTFATRDLFRALHQQAEYYVLWLNRDKARLIHAINGMVIEEQKERFPVRNMVAGSDSAKQAMDRDPKVLFSEYFNQVDKALVKKLNENPLPVVLATEARNADLYRAVADRKEFLTVDFSPSRQDLSPLHLVEEAWKIYAPVVKAKYDQRTEVLEKAASAGRLYSDHNDIWRALQEGKGSTLFVREGLFQPAMLQNDEVELLPASERERVDAVDDIIDEMIERNRATGGDAVFVSGTDLDPYNGLALVTRY